MGLCCSVTQLEEDATKLSRFVPTILRNKVIKVYDGDTITIAAKVAGYSGTYKFSVRLLGIDCPEMRGSCESEKLIATKARDYVASLAMGKEVTLENTSYDKYGRLLSRVKIGKVDIADSLISQRMAVPYDGGTKKSPSDWAEYFNHGSS